MEDVAAFLKRLHFRKKLLGGVDETDVWRQLELLEREYRAAYEAQEAYYQALLRERSAALARLRRQMGERSEEAKAGGGDA